MHKVLITGASGMVGYALCRVALEQNLLVTGLGRHDRHALHGVQFETIDLQSSNLIHTVIENHKPDIVVHLAANTNHSECQMAPELVAKLHVEASAILADVCYKIGSRFIHISTEAVYGNLGPGLRKEAELCKPEGVYAITKREGEIQVLTHHADALILRVTPVGYAPNGTGKTLFEWLHKQLTSCKPITGYTDVNFTPVSSFSLARLILDPRLNGIRGIYNWGNAEVISKFEFAQLVAVALGYGSDTILQGLRYASEMPFYGSMDSHALSDLTGIPIPTTDELITDLKHLIKPF